MNTLPFDIIEIINEKVHKMNMAEFVMPELKEHSPKIIFKSQVLPKIVNIAPLFTHTMCMACVINSATCVSCAQFNHKFENGPGYACGRRVVVDDDDIDADSYANLLMWQLMTGQEYDTYTMEGYSDVLQEYYRWWGL